MKLKTCALCNVEADVMYRIQIKKGKIWIFVCTVCCKKSQAFVDYKYGGTWKGSRH